jgi:ubiquinone/menaquinone biosynthesis C-methylase UbiE
VARLRRRAVGELAGDLVEIGFGSGLNIPLYPPAVRSVRAVEPSTLARKLATKRAAESDVRIEYVGLDGEELPLGDETVDGALTTFTLCTVPHPDRALRELFRVVKPGGSVGFLEHGRSPDPRVARWQVRLNPLQRKLFAGCQLDRQVDQLLVDAGFELTRLDNDQMPGPAFLKPFGFLYLGVATKPAPEPSR